MTLHCLYAGLNSRIPQQLMSQTAPGDCVLLLGAATELALETQSWAEALTGRGVAVYALDADLQASGILRPNAFVHGIDYARWVELSVQQRNQRLWR